jgi:N-acetylglucosamine-6-sulfatase
LLRYGQSPLPEDVLDVIDEYFRDRWRALKSVDDLVASVHASVAAKGMLNNTYFVYTSDHGYHIGANPFYCFFFFPKK